MTSTPGTQIVFHVKELRTEEEYDPVEIYNANTPSNALITSISGDSGEKTITTNSPEVLIRFISDYDGNQRGSTLRMVLKPTQVGF